jgi:hypothetical protein
MTFKIQCTHVEQFQSSVILLMQMKHDREPGDGNVTVRVTEAPEPQDGHPYPHVYMKVENKKSKTLAEFSAQVEESDIQVMLSPMSAIQQWFASELARQIKEGKK